MWLNHQGKVEADTHEGSYAYLLVQKLDRRLDSAESLRTAARVRLDEIPYTEKAL